MFETVVLRNLFQPNRDEITGEWTRLYNDPVHDLRPQEVPELFADQITKNDVGGACST